MGGVKVLQVRLKNTAPRAAIDLIRQIVGQCHAAGAVCLVNDRVDWAVACGADGAHVGDEDLPPKESRLALGADRILGVTVRRAAPVEGATYLGLGPIFE